MYNEIILENFQNPKNVGRMSEPDAFSEVTTSLCGDRTQLYLKIEDNIIIDAKFKTFGCAVAISASSVMTQMIIQRSVESALTIGADDIAREMGGLPAVKRHCSVLAADALQKALHTWAK